MNNTLQHLIRFPSGENRLYQAPHYHLIRPVISLLLGVCLLFFGAGTLVVDYAYAGWIELSPTGGPPVPRGAGTRAVSDPSTNRMIVFAGRWSNSGPTLNDTWVLTNANGLGGIPQWTQLSTAGSPPRRMNHSAVYDSTNNRMIIFGGCHGGCQPTLNDVWVLSHANGLGGTPTWTQLSPTGGQPARRQSHTAVYDSANNRMIIFGGQNGSGNSRATYGDVWILTNANGLDGTPAWIRLTPTGGPPLGQYGPSGVYDPTNNRMIVFGGNVSNAVWVLSNANGLGGTPIWTNLIAEGAAGSPPIVAGHSPSAVYNISNNEMTIFGHDGVWVLANANGLSGTPTWMERNPIGTAPAKRFGHGAVYDPVTDRMTIFGGNTYDGNSWNVSNDTWVFTNDDSNNGLVAYYPFNGNANDESGNENHGTVNGATLTEDISGNPDSAYYFDSSSFHIDIPKHLFESNSSTTISVWFFNEQDIIEETNRFDILTVANESAASRVGLSIGDISSAVNSEMFGVSGRQAPDFPRTAVSSSHFGASTIPSGWHHFVFVTNNQGHHFYLDGTSYVPDIFNGPWSASTNLLPVLGTSFAKIGGGSVNAILDDVRIYDRTLSESEVQQLYLLNGPPVQPLICQLYAVHDEGLNNSQLFTVNQTTLEVNALGDGCPGCDIEALDSHPETDKLFAASGDDTRKKGYLYEINQSGDLTVIGNIVDDGSIGNRTEGYDYKEVNALSFRADGTLWGWAENEGLLLINTVTAQAKLMIEYVGEIEDLTWNEAGTTLYGVENIHNDPVDSHGGVDFDEGMRLLAYDGEMVQSVCQELMNGFEIEALETLPGDLLLFGFHGSNNMNTGIIELSNCHLIAEKTISTPYNDVEGIAWPKKACTK